MEQCSSLGWIYYSEEDGMSELKKFLVQTTMELEATVLAAQDEISRKDEELVHMRDLLVAAVKERDEAQYKCQKLLLEKLSLQQKQLRNCKNYEENNGSSVARAADNNAASFSSSDSEDSIISEPPNPQSSPTSLPPMLVAALGKQRPLPEKGRLLQAVMEAGPILQTLLLAGPLPQWQHPPPQLDTIEIPPVTIPSSPLQVQSRLLMHQDSIASTGNNGCLVNNKRGLDSFDGSISSPSCSKYQRVV